MGVHALEDVFVHFLPVQAGKEEGVVNVAVAVALTAHGRAFMKKGRYGLPYARTWAGCQSFVVHYLSSHNVSG